MKIKLKEGVSPSDIPIFSGAYKMLKSMITSQDVVTFKDPMPKGWEKFFEEITTPSSKSKLKGDK